ncbi:type IV toxin-antitoxin system AbiEi family antitoxin domain-containing protein [Ornithinimicrobium avium]|uniref:AbiEi antitoxin N-terminal domain-containing protein n=1 Tax=Ornithinimicrobium avium TaxID=2283195 RepID=A0A345NPY9_9MICO|nr:type IV toxin-antitoxin system AbiEi family antitoxin domain-containing protein [Ornithinimicrobium avium]AXH97097.1 hypothetical protein DV701_14100 [Ornithinimicrobium avium]
MSDVRGSLAAHQGVATTVQLTALGVTPAELKGLLASGVLVRLRRATFIDGQLWRTTSPWEKHQLRARAVAAALVPGSPYALSHHSSLAVRGSACTAWTTGSIWCAPTVAGVGAEPWCTCTLRS